MNYLAEEAADSMPDLHHRLLESLSTAVVLVNENCEIEYINQASEAILGISISKARGQDISKILSDNEFDRKVLLESIRDCSPLVKRQATLHPEPSKQIIIDFCLTPVSIYNDTKFVFEIQEINRLVRISREESILASHDTTRQLVRGLAHEVKNPLGGIRGAAQLLQSELEDPELKEYTQVIADEVERLKMLVDDLLGPNQPMKLNSLNIHEVLNRVMTLISAESGGSVKIVADFDPSLPDIYGDLDQLIQAMLNITRNAVQAMIEAKTPSPRLVFRSRVQRQFTIGAKHHALVTRVEFEDNGPGIPPERIEEIFYPMITSRSEGSGLGLPIAQSIVSNHKGLIECSSEPGNTKFSVLVPIPEKRSN